MGFLPQQTLTLNTTTIVDCGGNVGAVVIYNESANAVQVQMGSMGPIAWLPAWTADRFDARTIASFDGHVKLTPFNISSSSNAPSSVCLINTYASGDEILGTYPMSLSRVTNIGNGVVNTSNSNAVILSGETAPNDLVKSSPTGYTHPTINIKDDGTITVYGLDNNTEKLLFQVLPSTSVAVAIKLLLAAVGSTGQLTIDELGNLATSGTLASSAASGLVLTKSLSAANQPYINVQPSDGDLWQIYELAGKDLTIYNYTQSVTPLRLTRTGGAQIGSATPLTIDTNGNLSGGTGTFSGAVSGTTGTFSGAVSGTTGTFSSAITATTGSLTGTLSSSASPAVSGTKALGGANQEYFDIAPSDGDHWGLFQLSTKHLSFYNYTQNKSPLQINRDGTVSVGGVINLANGTLTGCITFSGSGSGTVTHGLGVTPGYVGITENVLNSSMTVGVDNIGSTTVHVSTGTNSAWVGVAIK